MYDQDLEVDKKGDQPVNIKKNAKKSARKNTIAKRGKPGRKLDPATERMAFRLTPDEKGRLEALATAHNRSWSNYIRDVMVKHLDAMDGGAQ